MSHTGVDVLLLPLPSHAVHYRSNGLCVYVQYVSPLVSECVQSERIEFKNTCFQCCDPLIHTKRTFLTADEDV